MGTLDPVIFVGREELQLLDLEISLLEKNKERIDFHPELTNTRIENLRYCLDKLIKMTPNECRPQIYDWLKIRRHKGEQRKAEKSEHHEKNPNLISNRHYHL